MTLSWNFKKKYIYKIASGEIFEEFNTGYKISYHKSPA